MLKAKKQNITKEGDFSRPLLFPDNFFDVLPGGVVDHSAQMYIRQVVNCLREPCLRSGGCSPAADSGLG